jgi:hypothetical protein
MCRYPLHQTLPSGGENPTPEDLTRGDEPYASTYALRNYGPPRQRSEGAQILGRGLARLSISNNLVRDPLSLVESLQPCAFARADVHEDVLAAVIRLDESEALLAIEPVGRHKTAPEGGSAGAVLVLGLSEGPACRRR